MVVSTTFPKLLICILFFFALSFCLGLEGERDWPSNCCAESKEPVATSANCGYLCEARLAYMPLDPATASLIY